MREGECVMARWMSTGPGRSTLAEGGDHPPRIVDPALNLQIERFHGNRSSTKMHPLHILVRPA